MRPNVLERGRLECTREELQQYLHRMAELGFDQEQAIMLLKEEER